MKRILNLLFLAVANGFLLVGGCSKDAANPAVPSSSNQQTESPHGAVSAKTNTAPVSAQNADPVIQTDSLNFTGIELPHFLEFYAAISKAQLDTNQLGEVRGRYIAFRNTNEVTRSELIRLFDQALSDQVGIVATHLDAEHVVFKFRSSGAEK